LRNHRESAQFPTGVKEVVTLLVKSSLTEHRLA
jgi:hypothetical protein